MINSPSHDQDNVKQKETLQNKEGSGQVTALMQSFTDDEDYEKEESGSGEFPVTESVDENIDETNQTKVKDTGFNFGYGNNLIIERGQVDISAEEEDFFETSPKTLMTSSSYDYYDEEYVNTNKQTTPTSFSSDDEDYHYNEVGSGLQEIPKEHVSASETPNINVEDLEYYHEPDYEDEEEDEGWWKRKKRSASDDDSSIEALLSLDEYENDEYMNDIKRILSLDYERDNVESDNNYLFAVVDTNSGAIKGLDPCSNYTLDIQAVYDHNILIDSEEKDFQTLCQVTCDTKNLDFKAFIDKDTEKVVIKIENVPDCITEYALKYCHNQNCDAEYNLESTNSELIINDTFNPCLEYGFFLMPLSDRRESTNEENEWDNAIYRLINFESFHESPMSGAVGALSHQTVNISWLKANDCVDGYRISLYEIRHLPTLQPIYFDSKNEPLIKSMNLSSSDFSLEFSNLASCRLYRADIRSLYSSETGELLAAKYN